MDGETIFIVEQIGKRDTLSLRTNAGILNPPPNWWDLGYRIIIDGKEYKPITIYDEIHSKFVTRVIVIIPII